MKKVVVVGLVVVGAVITVFVGLVLFVFITNRTVDQTIATNLPVSREWTEIAIDSPLTAFRRVQEVDLVIPGYDHDPMARLPWGQTRLPDGRIISPEIEVSDEAGNTFGFRQSGYTMSAIDLVVYSSRMELPSDVRLTKVRIQSEEPFICERLFWRNRNPK